MNKLSSIRKYICIFLLLVASRAFLFIYFESTDETLGSSGNILLQLLWGIVYLGSGVFIIIYRERFLKILDFPQTIFFSVIFTYCFLSIIWSADPSLTFQRSVALIGTTLFSFTIITLFNFEQLKEIITDYYIIAIIGSVLLALFLPAFGTMLDHVEAGAWRGIYPHKNLLGRLMALGAVLFGGLALREKRNKNLLLSFCCFLLVILSQSAGALLISLALIAFVWLARILKIDTPFRIFSSITIVTISLLGLTISLLNPELVLGTFGKDITLTGRTVLWFYAWTAILDRFYLGYGYSAFWAGVDSPSQKILNNISWEAPHSHNGILDLWLDVGLIGLLLFLSIFIYLIYRSFKNYRQKRSIQHEWAMIILLFLLLASIPESILLKQNDIHWILFIIAASIPSMNYLNSFKYYLIHEKFVDLR